MGLSAAHSAGQSLPCRIYAEVGGSGLLGAAAVLVGDSAFVVGAAGELHVRFQAFPLEEKCAHVIMS